MIRLVFFLLLSVFTAVCSFVPVFNIIANNSEFDNVFSPNISNFSYGLSEFGNFFIVINIIPFLKPRIYLNYYTLRYINTAIISPIILATFILNINPNDICNMFKSN